ncbi:hypothetical protein HMPREF3226_02498 [Prevotella corporis]|uniref:Uncharacterized protein n=1 Tax=Prevotella corporis TaxID=28128 RepID=A0A133PVN6_9BACT|nr:hypothetical protein HMPREF3226_02498 [Prevotella corporis]
MWMTCRRQKKDDRLSKNHTQKAHFDPSKALFVDINQKKE